MNSQETLRLHAAWLRGEDGGQRANLSDANLLGADLSDANLLGANLLGANLPLRAVLLGESVRGRRRWAWLDADGSLHSLRCGCRPFASLDEAREHFLSESYAGESAGHREEMRLSLDYWAAMIAARAKMLENKQ